MTTYQREQRKVGVRRNRHVQVKLLPCEFEELKTVAAHANMSHSTLLREALVRLLPHLKIPS